MSLEPIFAMNKRVINSFTMIGNTTSETIELDLVGGYAVHEIYSGTPTGTLTVEASNDGVNFFVVDTNALVGSAGQKMINQGNIHYKYIRINYTFSSGTGVLDVYVSGKRI